MAERFTDAVMLDLDSTVRDTRQRHHLSPRSNPESSWVDYAMACGGDTPMMGTIMIMRMARSIGWSIHLVSGCSEEARAITEDWLRKHDAPYDTLRLHTEFDEEHNGLYKVQVGRYLIDRGFDLKLVVEDWPEVARLIEQELHVPVLCVNPMYDDVPMADFEKTWTA